MDATDAPARQTDRKIGGGGPAPTSVDGAARGHAVHRPGAAVAARAAAHLALRAADPRTLTRVQMVLAPLCIIGCAAAFVAEVRIGDATPSFAALAVVPVLAASMLRSRWLITVVVGFAVLLQVWGVAGGLVDLDTAGTQIAVYMLTLVVAALLQIRATATSQTAVVATPAPELTTLEVPGHSVAEVIQVSPALRSSGNTTRSLPAALAHLLTPREVDVVMLAVHGCTARQVGERLFIGERTVETHLANAYGKLGVRTKGELIRLVSSISLEDFRTGTEAPQKATA